ncbi:hypothetical protein [Catellatospora tritici]|nr:hypothetical protein [Catellatospora tritici]MBV1854454.1 hypothetical protein [Catellatospora tritici]
MRTRRNCWSAGRRGEVDHAVPGSPPLGTGGQARPRAAAAAKVSGRCSTN